jgi:hypothetical protein
MTLTLLFFAGFVNHAMNSTDPAASKHGSTVIAIEFIYELTLSPLLRWVRATPVGLTQRML